MIKHYLKVAFRNLLKYKTQSLISIIGLAVGFACFALSAIWIRYETTYDNFHEGVERLYLAGTNSSSGDGFSYFSSDLLADYLMKNYPEVEKAGKMYCNINNDEVEYNGSRCPMRQLEADSAFISMFNIIAINGNNCMQLTKDQIVITDKAAKRIFGNESPIGKRLSFPQRDNEEKTIVAVIKSWEGHSILSFDILMPYPAWDSHWFRSQCYTFFRTYPNCDIKKLEQKLLNLKVQIEGTSFSVPTPVSLLSTLRKEHPDGRVNVRLNHIRLFACIGGLVILCGFFNYLTMFVTRIRMRKRELAIRKVNGASGGNLLTLFLSELIMLLIISLGIGAMMMELLLPTFKRLSTINEDTSFFYGEVLTYMLFLILITTSVSAVIIYFIGKRTLLENMNNKSNLHLSNWFYKGSIICQLIISIGFVFCTVVMMKQLNFLLNSRELGLERHNIGVIYVCNKLMGVPFDKILDQMPDVTEKLYGFCTPIPKSTFLIFTLEDWEGKATGAGNIKIEQEPLNQNYIDFFHT